MDSELGEIYYVYLKDQTAAKNFYNINVEQNYPVRGLDDVRRRLGFFFYDDWDGEWINLSDKQVNALRKIFELW